MLAVGKIPYAATFAMFAAGRAYDQIRNSICYPKFNVKIVATHGGVTVGEDGASHQALEDVALMRNLPNMTVIVPADYNECQQVIKYAAEHNEPMYIRIPRTNLPNVFSSEYNFDLTAKVINEGNDISIISSLAFISFFITETESLLLLFLLNRFKYVGLILSFISL